MKLIIRKGQIKDLPTLFKLIKEEAKLSGLSHAIKNSLDKMEKEKKSIRFFLAEKNGEVIGMAVYSFVYYTWVGKSLYLDTLYVSKDHRDTGVGSSLLYKVFEVAKKEKCNRLRWQVEEENKPAQKFYMKLGATIGDKWFNCSFDKEGIKMFLVNNIENN